MTKDSSYFLGNITRIVPTMEDKTLETINTICLNFIPFPLDPEAMGCCSSNVGYDFSGGLQYFLLKH